MQITWVTNKESLNKKKKHHYWSYTKIQEPQLLGEVNEVRANNLVPVFLTPTFNLELSESRCAEGEVWIHKIVVWDCKGNLYRFLWKKKLIMNSNNLVCILENTVSSNSSGCTRSNGHEAGNCSISFTSEVILRVTAAPFGFSQWHCWIGFTMESS